ncbi:uncharacterized protein LOC142239393 [Haematobia irritans]|uniref:uncharacterized protein LOC142239393 n=1 Tax=Haematobia irritans TaxID=7368 RepID=UPI003F4F8880
MDLSAYSLPKLKGQKRKRQPNWTEQEKELLLSLTATHKAILENKGCDPTTIKLKTQAWDDIAFSMNAAGYNRSKDRLKQQLSRIRSAKKYRNSSEKCKSEGVFSSQEIRIKSESTASDSGDDDANFHNERQITLESAICNQFGNKKCIDSMSARTDNTPIKNILSGISPSSPTSTEPKRNDDDLLEEEIIDCNISNNSPEFGIRNHDRKRQFRKLYSYRLAVERERLRNIKEQAKRERLLFQKDVQIQNLKLAILQNFSKRISSENQIF